LAVFPEGDANIEMQKKVADTLARIIRDHSGNAAIIAEFE
jgi:hypothetical protein